MYRIWHSEWKMRLPPWFRCVLGPYIMNRFGNPGTVMPRYAEGRSRQNSLSETPSRPMNSMGKSTLLIWNPVANTMMSASYRVPSEVTTPCASM